MATRKVLVIPTSRLRGERESKLPYSLASNNPGGTCRLPE